MSTIDAIISRDFPSFLAKAFLSVHGRQLNRGSDDLNYVDYLASWLGAVATGEIKRACVSIAPRHLKTEIGIALAAFTLGIAPDTRIMVLSYSEELASDIVEGVRDLMLASWYKDAFSTRLSRVAIKKLATTAGGRLKSSWIGGGFTGFGADLLIIDDPVEIGDANNLDVLEKVNETFDNQIQTRLNSPKDSRIVLIAHRLNEFDLPGHVLAQGDWLHLRLPLVAPARRSYQLRDGRTWTVEKGELLRPDVFNAKTIRRMRKAANFEALYQQNVGRAKRRRIKAKHFGTFRIDELPADAVVLSVDPGFDSGDESSYTVIQAWVKAGGRHYLFDQWRAQEEYDEVAEAIVHMRRTYRPTKILIESTGYGLALCRHRKLRKFVEKIRPGNRSKDERLAPHIKSIRAGDVLVLENSDFHDEFIEEVVGFSLGRAVYDDQVDAMTQYLDYRIIHPDLEMPAPRAAAVLLLQDGSSITPDLQVRALAHNEASSLERLGANGHLPGGTGLPLGGSAQLPPEDTWPSPSAAHSTVWPVLGRVGHAAPSRADRLAELQAVQDRVYRRLGRR